MNSLYRRQGLDVTKFGSQTYSETVDILTLDNYLDQNKLERVDYLKVDVEGHDVGIVDIQEEGVDLRLHHEEIGVESESGLIRRNRRRGEGCGQRQFYLSGLSGEQGLRELSLSNHDFHVAVQVFL